MPNATTAPLRFGLTCVTSIFCICICIVFLPAVQYRAIAVLELALCQYREMRQADETHAGFGPLHHTPEQVRLHGQKYTIT